ncbi:MAG TPA: TetR family transcriptional regulator, partial [Trebonia sp.]|nr:TetR family transcriptional regulator [Trebonia sp.]
ETPRDQLLAIFDVFSEWFSQPDFEGCSFLTTMIEINDRDHPVHQAAVVHLANIRSYIERLAAEAGIRDADSFARKWHILMKGSIMAAHEGDAAAAGRARELGELLLAQYGC